MYDSYPRTSVWILMRPVTDRQSDTCFVFCESSKERANVWTTRQTWRHDTLLFCISIKRQKRACRVIFVRLLKVPNVCLERYTGASHSNISLLIDLLKLSAPPPLPPPHNCVIAFFLQLHKKKPAENCLYCIFLQQNGQTAWDCAWKQRPIFNQMCALLLVVLLFHFCH